MRFFRDLSLSAVSAGLVTVLVGFTSSAVIVFQAAQALGASEREIGSWMLALGLGMGLTGVGLSLYYRAPVATAWSTSGAALLITGSAGVSMAEAMGAFVLTGALIALCGFSGWFERASDKIPASLAAAMLAGVLLRFGLEAFGAGNTRTGLILALFVAYLGARRFLPRYAVPVSLLVGGALAASGGLLNLGAIHLTWAEPVFVPPLFSLHALFSVALPLFVVTMASQNLPAIAVLRAAGYPLPSSTLIGFTGLATMLLAPFGAFTLNLATLTAAICTGPEAHEDPAKRYVAGVTAGLAYMLVGLLGATVGGAIAAFPRELMLAAAGFALLGPLGNGLASALREEREREPALVTFLATASGLSLWGIGSAFWGLVAGGLALLILRAPLRSGRSRGAAEPLVLRG